ncbi:24060_t:CDS:1, partial [Gigaspora rosea]
KISTKAIEQIHTPLLQLAKNKAGLQVTESRAMISHKDIGNCKQLKKELFNKQAISLYHRLNEKGAVEVVTDIRINQGFLLAGISKGSGINECENIATKVWKHNLACLVLARLNTMQLSFKPDQKDWGLIENAKELHQS